MAKKQRDRGLCLAGGDQVWPELGQDGERLGSSPEGSGSPSGREGGSPGEGRGRLITVHQHLLVAPEFLGT